ncbi:MAG: TolB family protein, partial [Gaiellaceae bacterium]
GFHTSLSIARLPPGHQTALDRVYVSARLLEARAHAPDGSGERRLLPGYPLTESSPTWSLDGRIVFSRGAKTARWRGIVSVRADGAGLRRLRANGGDPTVSLDGRLLAFTWMPDCANQELFVMRRNGTGVRSPPRTASPSAARTGNEARGRCRRAR